MLLICPPGVKGQSRPFRYPEKQWGNGELRYINGLPVLTVTGSPEQIGEAVGVLAVKPGRRMLEYPEDVLRRYHLHFLWQPLLAMGKARLENFPGRYRREMESIVRSGGVDRDHVIAGNTLFDIKKYLACSALLVAPRRSITGASLVGRNLDYPSLGYAQEYSLVTIYRPAGVRHAFASVGFPGLVGCLSGMNDAGLTVAILEAFQARAGIKRCDHRGLPYALCYRRLLEECATVSEAITLLAAMHRSTMTNLVLADRNTVAVAEVTPEHVVVRHPEQGICVCTNHYCSDILKPVVPVNFYHTFQRYDILQRVARKSGPLGLTDIHRGLHEACNPEETLQSMIFDPAALRLYLAIGRCPASGIDMGLLELAPLFR